MTATLLPVIAQMALDSHSARAAAASRIAREISDLQALSKALATPGRSTAGYLSSGFTSALSGDLGRIQGSEQTLFALLRVYGAEAGWDAARIDAELAEAISEPWAWASKMGL